jgi:hypothetical protein
VPYEHGAARLRELAGQLRHHADRTQGMLDPVRALDDAKTWQGSYPSTAHGMIAGWNGQLLRSSDQLRRRAGEIDQVAGDYEATAAAVRRVAAMKKPAG